VDWPNASMQLTETGFECTAPLFNTLKKVLAPRQLGNRKVVIGGARDKDGKLQLWDETDVLDSKGEFNSTLLAIFVRASSAIPGIFESVKFDDVVYSDGTIVMGIDVFSGINRCQAAGYASEDIVVDIITTASNRLKPWDPSTNNKAAEVEARASEVGTFSATMADIFDACRAYPEVEWRYFAQAPTDLPGSQASFDVDTMSKMMAAGEAQAPNLTRGVHCSEAEKYRKSNVMRPAHFTQLSV